jgi:hypothetical protein
MRSTEILHLLAEDGGGCLVYQAGAPFTDSKLPTVTVKRADGCEIAVLPGQQGGQIIEDFVRASLIYEAVPLDDRFRRVYRLTPDGLARGTAIAVA